jgi:hypothetical protein
LAFAALATGNFPAPFPFTRSAYIARQGELQLVGTILLIVLIILLLGGGGGYYGHRRYGGRGLGGVLGLVLVVILVLWLVGALGTAHL